MRKRPIVGFLTVSLNGERTDLAETFSVTASKKIKQSGLQVIEKKQIYTDGGEVISSTQYMKEKGASCIVFLIGTWVYTPTVVTAIQKIELPVVIWGVPEGASFSSVGTNAVHGTLDEIGIDHELVYGMPNDVEIINRIVEYAEAAMVKKVLFGSRFGLLGGRSIGMYPSTADPIQVKRIFGIEIEHIDQSLLIEYAKKISNNIALEFYVKMKEDYGDFRELNQEVMLRSIKLLFALKKIIDEYKLDFMGVKCLEEVINLYSSCCLAISILNNEGYVTACQSDVNAAILMQIMDMLTSEPTIFADVSTIKKESGEARLINCGTMPTSLSKSKKEVDWSLQYEYMGKARGACPTFCCKEGLVTITSLSRVKGKYVMLITSGEAYESPKSVFSEVRDIWPQAFIKLACDPIDFFNNIRSNHVVVGYGTVKKQLKLLCKLIGISTIAL